MIARLRASTSRPCPSDRGASFSGFAIELIGWLRASGRWHRPAAASEACRSIRPAAGSRGADAILRRGHLPSAHSSKLFSAPVLSWTWSQIDLLTLVARCALFGIFVIPPYHPTLSPHPNRSSRRMCHGIPHAGCKSASSTAPWAVCRYAQDVASELLASAGSSSAS